MLENTIGNKKKFAIEYKVQKVNPSPPYGGCLIWISELPLGDAEDPIFLTSVLSCLEGILERKDDIILDKDYSNKDKFELFDELLNDESGTYWILNTEGFDIFYKYAYKEEEHFVFLWKIRPEFEDDKDYISIPKGLQVAQVEIDVYAQVLKDFRTALSGLYGLVKKTQQSG